ncbi:MAG: hypothetical protein ACOX1P_17515 [Thermoguttaceae bacterium]
MRIDADVMLGDRERAGKTARFGTTMPLALRLASLPLAGGQRLRLRRSSYRGGKLPAACRPQ